MFGILSDCFYWDKSDKKIKYIKDITVDYILNNFDININTFNLLKLTYGTEPIYDIRRLGAFNKYNPNFLHPEILIFTKINNKWELEDKIIF